MIPITQHNHVSVCSYFVEYDLNKVLHKVLSSIGTFSKVRLRLSLLHKVLSSIGTFSKVRLRLSLLLPSLRHTNGSLSNHYLCYCVCVCRQHLEWYILLPSRLVRDKSLVTPYHLLVSSSQWRISYTL